MYITVRSGHYQAARALERGLRVVDPAVETLTIDAFQYLNPILAPIVDRLYMSVIQRLPELWDYLYDNPRIVRRSSRYRDLLHRYDSPRLEGLLRDFKPEAVACTQAFPCGLVADYKKRRGVRMPLYGVVTDFVPHAYWVHDCVDGYMVASDRSRRWMLDRQVPEEKVFATGIPIQPVFAETPDAERIRSRLQLKPGVPVILLMGGGQGLGPLKETVRALDRIADPFQMLVVTGSNQRLYHTLIREMPRLRHPIEVFGHVDFIADLMSAADLLITKPGGLTTSEALAKGVPLVVVEPIPGQENKNANFLKEAGVAVQADHPADVPKVVADLLNDPARLQGLQTKARALGRPDSAIQIARRVLSGFSPEA